MHRSSRYAKRITLTQEEIDSLTSARLRHGGSYTIPLMGLAVEHIAKYGTYDSCASVKEIVH